MVQTSQQQSELNDMYILSNFAKAIDNILIQNGKDPIQVYGCTNYMDVRFIHTLNAFKEFSGKVKAEHIIDLKHAYNAFLELLDKNNNKYIWTGSGTYELQVPYNVLIGLSNVFSQVIV